jgi:Ca2+-transporting ATPase
VPEEAYGGLTAEEAAQRLRQHGFNELAVRDRRNFLRVLMEALREPLLLLLIVTTAFYLAIGDWHEGALLAVLTVVDLGIVVYQDLKTERVLESLRDLASPRALVIRDGVQRRIPGREVVPGDIVIVSEGDRVPADAELTSAHELKADESLLTGEAVPVRKMAAAIAVSHPVHPGGEDTPLIFSGSMIVHGRGIATVTATGAKTQIGRIGVSLSQMNFEETRLRRGTRNLVRDLGILAAVVSALVIVLQGMRADDWLGAILAGATTAMSLMPEEIPIVLTVFLTLGAWRISRRNVLTRQVAAIENLGSATVLCTDKTGTLTLNRMTVTKLHARGETIDRKPKHQLSTDAMRVLAAAAKASEIRPTDPMERAFHDAAAEHDVPKPAAPLRIYGLSPDLLAVTFVRALANGRFDVAAKGAPEAILSLCSMNEQQRCALLEQTSAMASEGLRVLAVAAAMHEANLPETPRGFAFEFLGLVGLSDPVRDTVPAAVAECRQAGVRVIMITGDYPVTARAIARQAGIEVSGDVVTGQQLNELSDEALAKLLPTATVFARVLPEQKLRIVSGLKALGHVVAMTGDGVNDAPALKAANIGIAMGGRGADVAREAAALVLLDDAFESIVAAIRMGRRIFDNLRKALSYILAVHVPIAGVALLPLLFGWPIVFFPVHVVFLELIIDPACSIAFEAEPEEPDTMWRGPRKPSAALFDSRDVIVGVSEGAIGLAGILGVYAFALDRGVGEPEARAMAFAGIVFVNLALILANRSRWESLMGSLSRQNPFLWWVVGAALAVLMFALYVEPVSELFRFAPLGAGQLLLTLAPAAVMLAATEVLKSLRRRAYRLRALEQGRSHL